MASEEFIVVATFNIPGIKLHIHFRKNKLIIDENLVLDNGSCSSLYATFCCLIWIVLLTPFHATCNLLIHIVMDLIRISRLTLVLPCINHYLEYFFIRILLKCCYFIVQKRTSSHIFIIRLYPK